MKIFKKYVNRKNKTLLSVVLIMFMIFTFLTPVNVYASTASWNVVGTEGFSATMAYNTRIAIDGSGTPYVSYQDIGNSNKATVKKYDGTSWVTVGIEGFSDGKASNTEMAIDRSGTPYVVYTDAENDSKITVKKYDGTSWVTVGTEGFSDSIAGSTSIAIDRSGTPYVVYKDYGNSGKATVMKYDGTSWVTVGTKGFSGDSASFTRIVIDGSVTPYVAYYDYGHNNKATVKKYDGTSWVTVGTEGFSANSTYSLSLATDASGTPYIAYQGGDNDSNGITVKKYDGNNWVTVGNDGFLYDGTYTSSIYYISLTIDGSGTPYVAYSNFGANVKKYDGSSWMTVGTEGFSASGATYVSIAIDRSGTPYVVYSDSQYSNKTTVMKYTVVDRTIETVDSIEDLAVPNGTDISSLHLKETVDVKLNDSTTTSASIKWDKGNPRYDGTTADTYKFTGTLILPNGVSNGNNLTASLNVIVGESIDPLTVDIKGTKRVGSTLSAELVDKDGNIFTTSSAVTYEWYRLSSADSKNKTSVGNNSTYMLVSGDEGNYIKLVVYCEGKKLGTDTTEVIASKPPNSSHREVVVQTLKKVIKRLQQIAIKFHH